jgi:hypothetical protein
MNNLPYQTAKRSPTGLKDGQTAFTVRHIAIMSSRNRVDYTSWEWLRQNKTNGCGV